MQQNKHIELKALLIAVGSLVVACLPMDTRFAASNPAEDDGIFKGDKNPSHDFLLKGSIAVGPML
jgi:hypothetical protein